MWARLRWLLRTSLLAVSGAVPHRRLLPRRPLVALALATALCGATTAMLVISLRPRAAAWTAFGISLAMVAVSLAAIALGVIGRRRLLGLTQAALLVMAIVVAVFAAGALPAPAARWVAFGAAVGYLVHGVVHLASLAARDDHVVHVLDVRGMPKGAA